MRKWTIVVVVVVALAGAGWYFGSPWWTLYQVKQAAERKDVEALIGYIDFDALKLDIKTQMHAQARQEAAAEHSPIDPAAEEMADQTVDSEVSAGNVRQFLRAQFGAKPNAAAAPSSSGGGEPGGSSPADQIGKNIALDRAAFDTFVVHGRDKPDGVWLTFKLHGLGWRLAGLRLPASAL